MDAPAALQLIPAKVRLWLYCAYAVAGLAVAGLAAYFPAVGAPTPRFVAGTLAVLGVLAAPFGAMAGSNVTKPADPPADVAPEMAAPE